MQEQLTDVKQLGIEGKNQRQNQFHINPLTKYCQGDASVIICKRSGMC